MRVLSAPVVAAVLLGVMAIAASAAERRAAHLATPGTREHLTFPFGPGTVFSTEEPLVDSDDDGGQPDLYVRERTGRYVLVSTPTGVPDPGTPVRAAGLNDGVFDSAVYFTSAGRYTSDDDDGGRVDVYARRRGVTQLVTKPDGVPDTATGDATLVAVDRYAELPVVYFATTQQMTPDDTDGGGVDIYRRSENSYTSLISRVDGFDTPDSDPTPVSTSRFGFERGGGRRAYFTTTASLDADDADLGRSDVYVRDADDTRLVSRAEGAGPDAGAFDAELEEVFDYPRHRVFFSTRQPMTGDDMDGTGFDGFVRDRGQTTLVTTGPTDPHTGDAEIDDVARDGGPVLFRTAARMTPADGDSNRVDAYVRRTTGETSLVSRPSGVPDPDAAGTGPGRFSYLGRMVLFETRERLARNDRDGQTDIYRYRDGRTTRVSAPSGVRDPATPNDLSLSAASIAYDERHVFFVTGKRLTPNDNDSRRRDVYVNAGGTTALVSKARGVPQPDTGDAWLEPDDLVSPHRFYFATSERLGALDRDGGSVDAYYSNLLPALRFVRFEPREFRVDEGTTIRFSVTERVRLTVVFRRKGSAAVVGRRRFRGVLHTNSVLFNGRLDSGKRLKPGRYIATFVARDLDGDRSQPVPRPLRILSPK